MADTDEQNGSDTPAQISRTERLHFIGFDVFPGEGKELFSSKGEEEKYLDDVRSKRSRGDYIREACTLLGERISFAERMVLAIAAVLTIGSLFLPWYTVYNEVVEDIQSDNAAVEAQTDDGLALSGSEGSGADLTAQIDNGPATPAGETVFQSDIAASDDAPASGEEEGDGAAGGPDISEVSGEGIRGNEQIITAQQLRASVERDYSRLVGYEVFASLGSLSSHVFSAGIVIILSTLLMFIYELLCVLFPAYILYNVLMLKGDADEIALKLKKLFSYGWIPVVLFVVTLLLSLVGGSYGPTTVGTFSSLGESYNIGVFLGMLSWGTFMSLVGFIVIAVKGAEI